jgi:hypothetical protein
MPGEKSFLIPEGLASLPDKLGVQEGDYAPVRIYDVYRDQSLRACIRRHDDGRIEWAYRQEEAGWQGFWWPNEVKSEIERMIEEYPSLAEFAVSDFTIRRRNPTA